MELWGPELECGAGSVGQLVCAHLTVTPCLQCVPCDEYQKLRTSPVVLSEVCGAGRAGQEVLSAQIRGIALPHRPKAYLFITVKLRELESRHSLCVDPWTESELLPDLLEKLAFSFVHGNKEKRKTDPKG